MQGENRNYPTKIGKKIQLLYLCLCGEDHRIAKSAQGVYFIRLEAHSRFILA